MGIWSAVKSALNSTLGTSSFQPLDYWIKNNNTASSTGTLSQKLSYLINSPKIVKSIQTGTSTADSAITISTVNVSKSIAFIDGGGHRASSNGNYVYGGPYYISAFSSTSITITNSNASQSGGDMVCRWWVIEFY